MITDLPDRFGHATTIGDVAHALGMSQMTVSRALAGKPGVSAQTREKVLEMAQQLGYNYNPLQRRQSNKATGTLGLITTYIGRPYIADLIQGVELVLSNTDYDLIIYNIRNVDDKRQAIDAFAHGMVEGMIVAAPLYESSYDQLEEMKRTKLPFVLVDQRVSVADVPFVIATNHQGAYDATRYLAQMGHRRIAHITGDMAQATSRERLQGYRDALAVAGLPADDELIKNGAFYEPAAIQATEELLRLPAERRPTAIFAANDEMAFGCINTAQRLGLRVPDDVSVIGFDDIPTAAHVVPSLTTVSAHIRNMGEAAARMLLSMLASGRTVEPELISTSLVLRESTAPPPRAA